MPVSFYEAVWIFLIYAFLGWCVEVAFAAFRSGTFVNRGFLNGPLCPVYGCGVLAVVVTLSPLEQNIFLLFLGSFLLVSAIELLTGFLLERLFHNKWWDYSERKFNIHGYICLLFSVLWGVGCTIVLKLFHPIIYKVIRLIPQTPGKVLLILLCNVFLVDLAITVASILKFNERLKLLNEIAGKIKTISDEIGENIYGGVSVAVEKGGELKESFDLKATELKESVDSKTAEWKAERTRLQQQYHSLMSENVSFGMKRIMRAFPRMKSNAHQEALLKLKNYWNEKRRRS